MSLHISAEIRWNVRVLALGLITALGSAVSLLAVDIPVPTNTPPLSQTVEGDQPAPIQSSQNNERLRKALKRFPAADANGDGVLTLEEARAFREKSTNGQSSSARSKGGTNDLALGNPPTFDDVKYGPYGRNRLDFWQAKSKKPAPVVVFIHGGGFKTGDKTQARKDPMLEQFLKAGISFAAINYRFREHAPIQDILHDAARAIQFIRYKAADWNVDKKRIAAYGGSAGAGTSLWLAAHDDLADPKKPDPVLRESSRLVAAGLFSTQATYDLLRWEEFLGPFKPEWLQSTNEIAEFYHFKAPADLKMPEGERVRAECDMLRWLSKDDPPIYALTTQPGGPSQNRGQHLHHPDHVREIQKRCKEVGVECVAILPDDNPVPGAWRDGFLKFMKRNLGVRAGN
jgi:acetyl esterase